MNEATLRRIENLLAGLRPRGIIGLSGHDRANYELGFDEARSGAIEQVGIATGRRTASGLSITVSDPRDAILQKHAPAVMVPRFGALPLMEKPGHRYLVAANGIWLEVLRPWLHARVNIGHTESPLPYGTVEALIQYAFKPDAITLIQHRFLQAAAGAFPNECAAWAVYDERTGELDYRPLPADEASPGSITFQRPPLGDHEHLAIDLHSHGAMNAFFSGTDDEDDTGEVKIAVVAGKIDTAPTFATRLCLLGTFVEANSP